MEVPVILSPKDRQISIQMAKKKQLKSDDIKPTSMDLAITLESGFCSPFTPDNWSKISRKKMPNHKYPKKMVNNAHRKTAR